MKGLDRVFLVQGWSVCGWPSILIAGVGGMVARYGRFGGKYCILMESISTLWSVLPGYMSQSVCGGGVTWSIEFHMWYLWLPASYPRPFHVVLVGGSRCSVVFFGRVSFSRTFVIL